MTRFAFAITSRGSASITPRSLEQCFRLLIALVSAFHDEEGMEERDAFGLACDWLEAYARAVGDVEFDSSPTEDTGKLRPRFTAVLRSLARCPLSSEGETRPQWHRAQRTAPPGRQLEVRLSLEAIREPPPRSRNAGGGRRFRAGAAVLLGRTARRGFAQVEAPKME